MQKGVFVDLVLIRANGGILNDEAAIKRADVQAYLPAAINYVLTAQYWTNIKGEGNRDFSGTFYGYYPNITLLTDATKNNRKYFVLPKGVVPMVANQGIRSVTDGCEKTYKPIPDGSASSINYYTKIFKNTGFYRLEGKNVYLYGINPLQTKINVTLIVRAEDLADTDELPIPAGLEDTALEMALAFVTGQRQIPADTINNKKDIN